MPTLETEEMWSFERVREELRTAETVDGVSAVVFFDEATAVDAILEAATAAVARLYEKSTISKQIVIGHVFRLAKSVSVRGDADTIAELMKESNVKAVLPSPVSDIYPKPMSFDRKV